MLAFELTPFWGTLPDWLAAAGTIGAFFAGLRLLRKELDTRREALEDRRRAQARLVAAWTDIQPVPGLLGPPITIPPYEHVFFVRNGSEEPVYDVSIIMVAEDSPYADDPEAAWRKDGALEAGAMHAHFSIVPPGERIRNTIPAAVAPSPYPPCALSFTDAQERRWKRYPNGRLEGPSEPRRSVKDRLDAWARGRMDELDT
jgi:hypothetical protein